MNKVLLFNQNIQNLISNCIPHENLTCGNRNPSWIDETIQKLVLHKKCTYIAYSRDNDEMLLFGEHTFNDAKNTYFLIATIVSTFLIFD